MILVLVRTDHDVQARAAGRLVLLRRIANVLHHGGHRDLVARERATVD